MLIGAGFLPATAPQWAGAQQTGSTATSQMAPPGGVSLEYTGIGGITPPTELSAGFRGYGSSLPPVALSLEFTGYGAPSPPENIQLSFAGYRGPSPPQSLRLSFRGNEQEETISIQLFDEVPEQNTSVFRDRAFNGLEVDTTKFSRIAFRMAPEYSGTVMVPVGHSVYLSGNAAGDASVEIDNFLLLEIEGHAPVVIGSTAEVLSNGRPLRRIGRQSFAFAAREIDLTAYFRPGQPTALRANALDYGGFGKASDVFLVMVPE